MLFEFAPFSALLLIFFVHGLVYAILLFRKGWQRESQADKWLGFFLLLCIFFIGPWMVGFAGWYNNQPYRDILFYVPFQQLYFFGPVIFFYVQSLLNPGFRFTKRHWLHLLPGVLYLLFCVIMVITDKIILGRYYFLASQQDPDFDDWYQWTGFASMLIYFIASLRYYNLYKKMVVQVISYAGLVQFKWVRNFLMAFLVMISLKVIFAIVSALFPVLDSYMGSWWFFFAFAIVFYYIAITGYANSIETKVPFKVDLFNQRQIQLLGPATEPQVIDVEAEEVLSDKLVVVEDEQVSAWKEKLVQLMEDGRGYEDPELSLTQVARQLGTNPSLVSKVVNQGFSQNFNDFINSYRVNAVINMLRDGEQQQQTLLGIAYDCGFNSKATFNRAFKKQTGQSPKDYISVMGL